MMNRIPYTIKEYYKNIPFIKILLPYIDHFTNENDLELPLLVKDKIEHKLLEDLSYTAEVALHYELDKFIKDGNNNFEEFTEKMTLSIPKDYPVLDKKLRTKSHDFLNHIINIVGAFRKDIKDIEYKFDLKNIKIVDIDVCLGDGHNGESTSSVCLSDGTKLIYKPRNIGITYSYNSFIDWVNSRINTDLKTFKVLNYDNYGWIEFVHNESVHTKKDLEEYYRKAGVLLAVTLLLGSRDCHHENVIASGKNPVIIDHETIIQPFFNDKSFRSWDDQFKIPPFSVLESVLIVNQDTGAPLDNVGYGVRGHVEVTGLERKVINPNTINSKITTSFAAKNIVEKNIPVFEGKYHFVNEYRNYFIDGFSVTYDMFLNSKEELRSKNSPLKLFTGNGVRYVWRPTFIYFKILKYLRSASFMSSYEVHCSKLQDLLSKAFKGEDRENYRFILDFEVKQMLNGDIPIFNLNSSDNFLENENSLKVFEHNCLENMYHRMESLTVEHKEKQIEHILHWTNL
jgi:type 2 lantibiotic biosynthesis protein LanM